MSHASRTQRVTAADTAARFGANFPEAAATPFVLGLAEVACHEAVQATLADGEVTVGVRATIEHLLPSPVGAELRADAVLVQRDGRLLAFEVLVYDGREVCARVQHDRAIVLSQRIIDRLAAREATA